MIERKNLDVNNIMIWVCMTMFYCYQYVLRIIPNMLMPNIMNKFAIGASEFGTFAGIYYMGYIVVHIPLGILLSCYGGKRVLPFCIGLSAIGLIPLVYMDTWYAAVVGRILTGIGSSAAAIGALQIFQIIYKENFSKYLGSMVCVGLIVAVYSGPHLTNVINLFGADTTISILIYCGVFLSIITYIFMPHLTTKKKEKLNIRSDIKDAIFVIRNHKLLLTSICAGLMIGPLEGFGDAWGSAFFIKVYGLGVMDANSFVLSIFLGMCIGCIILPYIADRTRQYFSVTIVSAIVMFICFICIVTGAVKINMLQYLCFIIGIFCAYQIVIIAKILTFVPVIHGGMAASIANMIIMVFGWIFHSAIGLTLDYLWQGEIQEGMKIYSNSAFMKAISIIPAAMLIAIIGLFIIAISDVRNSCRYKKI